MSEERGAVDAMVQLSFLVQNALAAASAPHELSIVQVRLLGVLRDREPGMQALGATLGLDKSSTTGLVDRAERRGLVRRSRSPHDRRGVTVSLTDSGRHVAADVVARIDVAMQELTASLTPGELDTLVASANRVLDAAAAPADS